MGEVYRARDARLNRDVAVKILREQGASTADGRSRFEREARAVAALSHPNIVAVFDVGVEGDRQYIVSELIEGESLRAMLTGSPVPVRKLIDIATQIADRASGSEAGKRDGYAGRPGKDSGFWAGAVRCGRQRPGRRKRRNSGDFARNVGPQQFNR